MIIRKQNRPDRKGVRRREITMRLKVPYEIMEVEGQSFAVPMEGDGKMIRLSRTARVIFELLREETDEAAIVDSLSRCYDVDLDVLKTDVRRVIEIFKEKDVLV